jgi:hypothetical protein
MAPCVDQAPDVQVRRTSLEGVGAVSHSLKERSWVFDPQGRPAFLERAGQPARAGEAAMLGLSAIDRSSACGAKLIPASR